MSLRKKLAVGTTLVVFGIGIMALETIMYRKQKVERDADWARRFENLSKRTAMIVKNLDEIQTKTPTTEDLEKVQLDIDYWNIICKEF